MNVVETESSELFYKQGIVVDKDEKKAFELFTKAANQGDTNAKSI